MEPRMARMRGVRAPHRRTAHTAHPPIRGCAAGCAVGGANAAPRARRWVTGGWGGVVRSERRAVTAPQDRTSPPARWLAVTLSDENALSRFRAPPHPHPPPCGPQRAAHGRPRADVTTASAGIRKTPTGRYKVWWRLDDASQGSPTFATRDQARDFKHDLLAGWPTGAGSTHNSAGRPSRPGRASGGKAGPPIPTTAPGHSKPQRRACAGTCVGSGHQTTGGDVAGCLGGCSGSGSAADRQGGTTYQNDRGMTSGRETTAKGGRYGEAVADP
jgi:hypothetical protein